MRRVCVFCASAVGARPDYARDAEALGRAIARRGLGLVYGGGAVGLMGVVSRAVLAAGGDVTGIIPHGLVKREAGNGELKDLRIVASMHERKAMMAEMSDGFLVLPGGFGTLEEVVEALTWLQLGIHSKPVVFIDTLGFWQKQMAMFDHMVAEGLLKPEMRPMARIAANPEAALDALSTFTPPAVPRWLLPGEG
ncbi:TIGR00730 family Rossman fold protein [Roseomonas sp. CAU 1739]|uniref:LOG family protein n=1 Tax=Roseomonas sp. CAU 1739 TaxID=3140364 RepID=UPI00325B8EB1